MKKTIVSTLLALAVTLAAGAALGQANPKKPRPAPKKPAGILYQESERENLAPRRFLYVLTIEASGQFHLTTRKGSRTGLLDARSLRDLERKIRKARIVAKLHGGTCAGLPHSVFTVRARGQTASFPDQCGAQPHASLDSLRRFARALVAAKAAKQLPVIHNVAPRNVGSPPPDRYIVFEKNQFSAKPVALEIAGKSYPAGWGGVRGLPVITRPVPATLVLANGERMAFDLVRSEVH